jgi:hypothetical protein
VPVTADAAPWPADGPAAGIVAEAPRKPTRYEAMWTDCDPALWEYVVM